MRAVVYAHAMAAVDAIVQKAGSKEVKERLAAIVDRVEASPEKFLARFVVSDGIEGASQCVFHRRLGNPRRLIWIRWQAEHEAEF